MAVGKKLGVFLVGLLMVGLVAGILSCDLLLGDGSDKEATHPDGVRSGVMGAKKAFPLKKKRIRVDVSNSGARATRGGPPPNVFEDVDEAELTDLARKVLQSLQQALDTENYGEIRQILAMCSKAPVGALSRSGGLQSGRIPVMLRRKLVEAMGWFGAEAIPDLVEFIADADEDVAQMSKDQFQLALEDISLSDYERAKIVALAAQAVTEVDFLEQVFAEINDMRHSVGVSTLVNICQNGTEAAKTLMPEAIEFFTGEEDIRTVEDMEKWLRENPDGPDDDDLYGGIKE